MSKAAHEPILEGMAHPIAKLTAALVALLLVTAGTAHAGTVHKIAGPGAHIVFQAAPGEDNEMSIYESGGFVYVTDIGPPVTAGSGCEAIGSNSRCGTAGVTTVSVYAGNGDNSVSTTVSYDTRIEGAGANSNFFFGGPGDDELHGSTGRDKLHPGGGDDEVFGGGAADILSGGAGRDGLHGGEGDDEFWSDPGPEAFGGDGGVDRVTYFGRSAPIVVDLDNDLIFPQDGEAGEGDDVGSDIENVVGGAGDDKLLGQSGAVANDLDGGPGHDLLVGRGGIDSFHAGPGADEVRSADGTLDTADCGDDTDFYEADPFDTLIACETNLAPPPPAGTPAGPVTPAPAAATLRIGPRRVRLTRRGVARLRLRCTGGAAERCSGVLKLKRRTERTLGKRRFSVAAGATRTVRIRLPRAVRTRIEPRGLRARAVAVFAGGRASRAVRIMRAYRHE
jgi:RTX calcium-binding nonapeptide repeat (4 copies)